MNLDDPAVVVAAHVIEGIIVFLVVLLVWRVIERYQKSEANLEAKQKASSQTSVSVLNSGTQALEQMFADASQGTTLPSTAVSESSSATSPRSFSQTKDESSASPGSEDKALGSYIDGFFDPPRK